MASGCLSFKHPCSGCAEHNGSCAGCIPGRDPGHFGDEIILRGVGIMEHEALKPGRFPYLSDVYLISLHLNGHLDVGVMMEIAIRWLDAATEEKLLEILC